MAILFYVSGVIVMLLAFWITHEIKDVTWKELCIGILLSLGSWISVVVLIVALIYVGIIFFIEWIVNLKFWNKKVF